MTKYQVINHLSQESMTLVDDPSLPSLLFFNVFISLFIVILKVCKLSIEVHVNTSMVGVPLEINATLSFSMFLADISICKTVFCLLIILI